MAPDLIAVALADAPRRTRRGRGRRILSGVPAYRHADPAVLEDARRTPRSTTTCCATSCAATAPPAERELEFVERHAARRARRGIALADFLEAFRSYHDIVWDAVLDASRESRRRPTRRSARRAP